MTFRKAELRARRKDIRYPTNFTASLQQGSSHTSVAVRDISSNGMLIDGILLPVVGTRVKVIAAGLEVAALVVWKGDDQCGLLLNRAINPLAVVRDNVTSFSWNSAAAAPSHPV